MKPHRVQRKRTKGWRMPPNTIYVGRPTKWGNPYRFEDVGFSLSQFIDLIDLKLSNDPHLLDELRCKNLACWCRLDQPCHADILLAMSNR